MLLIRRAGFAGVAFCYTQAMKARTAQDVKTWRDIPNVGPAMERDFLRLGLKRPAELKQHDPLKLYVKLGQLDTQRPDPCVLDTYMAVIDFMNGAPARPWFYYTKQRKVQHPEV